MLKPGDVMRSYAKGIRTLDKKQAYDWTGIVISIDLGEISNPNLNQKARPATVTLLIDGPVMITKEFGWVIMNTRKVIDGLSDM